MTTPTILIADDDAAIRTVLTQAMTRRGYAVRVTGEAGTLAQWVEAGEGDVVITDVVLPDANIFEVLPRLRAARPDLPILVMSAQNTLLTAVSAAEHGAFDYLPKPFDLAELAGLVERALATGKEKAREKPAARAGETPKLPLIGRSPAMQEIYRTLARLMGTDLTVIILGESGTGKELVARALHRYGRRRDGPFVAINMAAIPRELIESELFGHEKGAFTGAHQQTEGRFAQADGGTLFLDEIGDMPFEAQTRLLRVLQEGEFTTVGGRRPVTTDVRIIAATNRDLGALVAAGKFREDLYYRLNVVPLRLPPLRDRKEDIPELARHFLQKAHEEGLPLKSIDDGALKALAAHHWPGNVRELENMMRRLVVLHGDEVIGAGMVKAALSSASPAAAAVANGDSLGEAVERHLARYFERHDGDLPPPGLHGRVLELVEAPLIRLTLAATRGNQLRAAEILGLNRNTLRKKIRELDIRVERG
jgi:two-component system nitrogen regulation response regulator GlnG